MATKVTSIQKDRKNDCPICGNNSRPPHVPFCSKRCSQLDLGYWLNEAYFIPTHNVQYDSETENLLVEIEKDLLLKN